MRTRHYSIRTEEAYAYWIKQFILFHSKRHPANMGEPHIGAFLSHLATVRNVRRIDRRGRACPSPAARERRIELV
ncbi:MAG TPA: phage integrase N-terminal SAM-like domain-containing protein [Blastocatellia bacterium]